MILFKYIIKIIGLAALLFFFASLLKNAVDWMVVNCDNMLLIKIAGAICGAGFLIFLKIVWLGVKED